MEIVTPKPTRHSTRLRAQIPLTMTSLDRRHAFVAECVALIVSPYGAGLQTPQGLPIETPVMLSGLPGGASASGRVASCVPLGNDGRHYLIGISLYNPGNVWGIANPPEDWEVPAANAAAAARGALPQPSPAKATNTKTAATNRKDIWPYNLFSGHTEAHPGKK